MTSFGSKRANIAIAGGMIVVAMLLIGVWSSCAMAQSRERPPAGPPNEAAEKPAGGPSREAWRNEMARIPLPKKGCFKASYPALQWQEVPCTPPRKRPYAPQPYTAGGGRDFQAEVTGRITAAAGSFDTVRGVTSATGPDNAADSYSLQLNTNNFRTSLCDGAAHPADCLGWQQFVFDSRGELFMQYWLLGYVNNCPEDWSVLAMPDCYTSSWGVQVPAQSIGNLAQLRLEGVATEDGYDVIRLYTPDEIYTAPGDRNIFNLAQRGWTQAEFNVLGPGDSSAVNFNAGSMMAVRIDVNGGSREAPTCRAGGTTAETNNLNLVPPCCAYGGDSPAIVFWQSNNPGATSMCANGTSIGDTHLTNFAGLMFDFQAAGDFLLADTGPDFVVHTRQLSGAPTWPDASVNKAVALKMGPTRAAVCLNPARLVVDGRRVQLADGGGLGVPGGKIVRIRNTYVFTRPTAEEVRAEVNDGWINVSLGVGRVAQAKVRGLLGNANGNTGENDLAGRDRTVLRRPVSFPDLYRKFGDSWRLSERQSLAAQLCGRSTGGGNPRRSFYAGDLNVDVYKKARAACAAAGVPEGELLDACTLDTAVTGKSEAARVFIGAKPPRAVLRVGPYPAP
jgi:hypothetical protein